MKVLPFNKVLWHPTRLILLSELKDVNEAVSFQEIKRALSLTDGNLASHLRALEKQQMVSIQKSFKGKKPHTTIVITEKAKRHYDKLLDWFYSHFIEGG